MHIDVRRTGGIAGTTRTWRVDTDACPDPAAWSELVRALPADDPDVPADAARDDFEWTVSVEQRTVRIAGSRLDGPWAALVARARDEGSRA